MTNSADLRRAAVFYAVAEAEGITLAAQRIGKSAPAVHADLRRFERDVGVQLMERFGRGLRLTPAGRLMRDTIGRALADIQRVEHHVRAGEETALPLRIGAVGAFGRYVLMPRLLPSIAPDRMLTLRMGSHDELLTALQDAEIDLMLTYRPVVTVPIESEAIASEALVLVGVDARSRAMPDVEMARWITYDEYEYVFAQWFAAVHGSQPRALIKHDHFTELEEALMAVKSGRGVTIAPADACRAAGLPTDGPTATNTIFLCGAGARLASDDAALIRRCLNGDP